MNEIDIHKDISDMILLVEERTKTPEGTKQGYEVLWSIVRSNE